MMNQQSLPPYGQPPMHPSRRQHDLPYPSMPPNMRHQPYPSYYPPHVGGPMPPYPPQHYPQQWYPYQPMQQHMPPPPRHYQHPPMHPHHSYQPLVVSSYPMPPPQQHPAHALSTTIHPQSSPRPLQEAPTQPLSAHLSPPPPSTPSSINNVQETPPTSSAASNVSDTAPVALPVSEASPDEPFQPPLPWLSVTDQPFPPRIRRRRRRVFTPQSDADPVSFPSRDQMLGGDISDMVGSDVEALQTISGPMPSDDGTPQTSVAPSENDSTQPTTPSSAVASSAQARTQQTPTQPKSVRSFAPALPAMPVLPTSPTTPRKSHRDSVISEASKPDTGIETVTDGHITPRESTDVLPIASPNSDETHTIASPPRPPKSWADLVRSKAPATSQTSSAAVGHVPTAVEALKSENLADVLMTMPSDAALHPDKLSFLEPRGLVNTGNMCYMNSILQILIFCVPFYEFLDRVSREAAHSFKSDTPLIDAMILFMKEYRPITSATSVEQLRLRLKKEELEQYGEALIPENLYEVIRSLSRFRDMRRGHQQDAQEFLGFMLEELHEECVLTMKKAGSSSAIDGVPSSIVDYPVNKTDEDGWMEVGHKQKPSTTRSSGVVGIESPVTTIFGGKLRSELRVPGVRQSNTVEPFQSLQLDIGSPQVNNIIDALKGLSKPEAMQGEFNSPRGKVTATKQVYIEELPPVLILHLKRFQYDNSTKRTEKIWKKVGYPLDLEIPREAFPTQTRNKMLNHGGLAKYRLSGVIYHHGRNASGGHYTVDVRRQDGLEWVRLDDTVIRRIRSQDVAEGGSEEDPKVLAAALERHNRQQKLPSNGNMYEQIHDEEGEEEGEAGSERGWSQVNGAASGSGHTRSKSSIAAIVNGTSTRDSSGRQTPSQKVSGVKDNKVAYLLFYQKVVGGGN